AALLLSRARAPPLRPAGPRYGGVPPGSRRCASRWVLLQRRDRAGGGQDAPPRLHQLLRPLPPGRAEGPRIPLGFFPEPHPFHASESRPTGERSGCSPADRGLARTSPSRNTIVQIA